MMRAMRLPTLLVLLALPGCCLSVNPVLPVLPPPPNVPADVLLFTVPPREVASMASPAVEEHLASETPRLSTHEPERLAQVLAHEVRTGMEARHVIWAFRAHPVRVRDHGPPGGHTLLFGQGGPFAVGRYWVRLDEWGQVSAAGRY